MFFDVWTILNPFIKTVVYISALITIGSILFHFHFSKFFDSELAKYCESLIKKVSISGFFIGLIAFLSVAGNLGGELSSAINVSLILLSLETLSGKSALLFSVGFFVIIISIFGNNTFFNFAKSIGVIFILLSFVIVGHSTLKGFSAQILIVIHLFCISFWLGSFLPLKFMCMNKNTKKLSIISEKFGQYAVVYISSLLITGLIFSYIMVGGIGSLIFTRYGNFLMLKLFFVTAILSLGALNKFRLVPLLKKNYSEGTKKLKTSLQFEIVITLLILFVTSILTTSVSTPMGV